MSLSLAYREYGKGPPMVILHGLFGSAQNWHSMAERLARELPRASPATCATTAARPGPTV